MQLISANRNSLMFSMLLRISRDCTGSLHAILPENAVNYLQFSARTTAARSAAKSCKIKALAFCMILLISS